MTLDPPGEPPRWGMNGARHPLDEKIVQARDEAFDVQQTLFKGFAGHLLAHQTQDLQPRWSGENDRQWLYNLATWFRWADEARDMAIREVLDDVMTVKPWEVRPDED